MYILHHNRLAFAYSSHKTMDRAEMALEDYFANGEVSEPEFAAIVKRGNRYVVLFWAD